MKTKAWLQVYMTWGGLRHWIRDIDVSDYTGPEISEIIVKQHSLLDGCECILRRGAPKHIVDGALANLAEKLTKS